MATPLRKQSPSIEQQLFEKPYEFEFPQAVKLLETLYAHKPRVGETAQANLEAVRFASNVFLSTPPSDLYILTPPELESSPARLTLNFMGIAGQTGPLPSLYTEVILDRIRQKDYAFREFLDIFNHRLASIHYRFQVKYRIGLKQDLPDAADVSTVLKYLGALTHCSEKGSEVPVSLPVRSYIKYGGLLWEKPHSAVGLETILRDYFHLPFFVDQFVGHWFVLEKRQCTRIGKGRHYNTLGDTASLGTKVWIQGEKIRIALDSLSLQDYLAFLPGNPKNKLVSELTRQYLGWEHTFDYHLSPKQDQTTLTRLDGKSALGWTAWLLGPEGGGDFRPESIVVKADDPLKRG